MKPMEPPGNWNSSLMDVSAVSSVCTSVPSVTNVTLKGADLARKKQVCHKLSHLKWPLQSVEFDLLSKQNPDFIDFEK